MTEHVSPYYLAVVFFGEDHFVPMYYSADVAADDLLAVAQQYVDEGKVRMARVMNGHTQHVLHELGWTRYSK